MTEAEITLPQVLLMDQVERRGETSPSELAEAMHASLPAVSQMIDRLVHQGLLDRTEDPRDRRRKTVAITTAAKAVLRKLKSSRASEYEVGLAQVAPDVLAQLAPLLEQAVAQLEESEKQGEELSAPSRATKVTR